MGTAITHYIISPDMNGWTDLHKLVLTNDFNKDLFDAHLHDVNSKTSTGSSPLHLSTIDGNQEIIIYLIRRGARVNSTNDRGETPLHWACKTGRTSIIKLLIKAGADISTPDLDGNTALHWAAEHNSHRIIKVLLQRGAKPTKNNQNQTPLEVAASNLATKAQKVFLSQ